MENYTVKNEDIKKAVTLIQMESGEVIVLDPRQDEENEKKVDAIFYSILNGNLINSIGTKVELFNGDWIKTDGKSIASRNVTDARYIGYLIEVVESMKKFYLECLNTLEAKSIFIGRQLMVLELDRLADKYGYC